MCTHDDADDDDVYDDDVVVCDDADDVVDDDDPDWNERIPTGIRITAASRSTDGRSTDSRSTDGRSTDGGRRTALGAQRTAGGHGAPARPAAGNTHTHTHAGTKAFQKRRDSLYDSVR